jgi:hypothetical protein
MIGVIFRRVAGSKAKIRIKMTAVGFWLFKGKYVIFFLLVSLKMEQLW